MKKNILYVTRIEKGANHIFNKVLAQVKGLKNNGYNVDVVYLNHNLKLYHNETVIGEFGNKLSVHFFFFRKLRKHLDVGKYDYCFIRNPFLLNQYSYLKFLKLLKEVSIKTILEIPTYPYEKELKSISQKVIYAFERFTHKKLRKYISLIVYSGNSYDKIYSIDAFQLVNVGDSKELPLTVSRDDGDILNLVGVSSCKNYHGYDRVIEGLYLYYESNSLSEIKFHIIGDGPERKSYEDLVSRYGLENKVVLHGKKYGQELNEVLNEMHIGISCLGMHRIGLETGSPLKTAEFAIRGLPMVLAYNDPFFSTCDFSYTIDGDESAVDISSIKKWYEDNSFNSKEIREFTINHISWEKQYKDIIEKI